MTGHEFDLVITVVSMLVLAGILAFLARITIAVVPMAEAMAGEDADVRSGWIFAQCQCGHDGFFHDHYRPGTDCAYGTSETGRCACPEFKLDGRTREAVAS